MIWNGLSRSLVEAHAGDTDKAGETYIRHPLRVMQQMDTQTECVVAVLHDVVEDTGYSLQDIEDRFGSTVGDAVDALTRREGEDYEEFIERVAANPIARRVKLADIEDNMDLTRLENLDGLLEKQRQYHQAWQRLKNRE